MDDERDQLGEAISDQDEDLAVDLLHDHPSLDVNRPWRMEHLISRACSAHMPRLARALLRRGADVNQVNPGGYSNLDVACREGYPDLVNVLLKHGARLTPLDPMHATPLHWAAQRGLLPVVKRLLDDGAPINAVCNLGSPLHLAIVANRRDVIDHLLERGSALHLTNDKGETPVMLAEGLNRPALVRALIDHERQTLAAVLPDTSAPSPAVGRGRRL